MENKKNIIIISALMIAIIIIVIITIVFTGKDSATNSATTIDKTDDNLETNNKATIQLGSNIKVDGSGVEVNGSNVTIVAGGEYTISGELKDGMLEVNTKEEQKVILNLNGINIKNSNGPAVCITNAKKTIIVLYGDNIIEDGEKYNIDAKATLFSNDTLKIKGDGNLEVVGNYKHAIASDDDIIIENGNITLSSLVDGIHVNDGFQLDGGLITVKTANDAIESEGIIIINGGTFNLACNDDGITAAGNVTINNGTFNISKCEEGIESKTLLTINDGLIEIESNDDGLNSTNMVINGGKIYCNARNGDAIDANGDVSINGGIIVATGANVPEGGLDFDNNTCQITGGTIIAAGGVNSTPTQSECTQHVVLLGNLGANSNIRIQDEAGNEVITFNLGKTYQSLLISSPNFKSDTNYIVYTGGEISETENFHGLYLDKTNYSNGEENTKFTTESILTNLGGNTFMMGGNMNMNGGKGQKGDMQPGGMPPNMGENPPEFNEEKNKIKGMDNT